MSAPAQDYFAEGLLVHNKTVDADGDGSAPWDDCDDDDATIYPGAPEICDDGEDNDCDGAIDGRDADCALSEGR